MAEKAALTLEKRSILGKKVKRLRREGLVPGNVYGRGLESVSVQAPLVEVQKVFRSVPRNSVVQVQITGEKKTRAVVLRKVDRNPLTGEVRHVELYEVDLTRLIQSPALIVFTGQSEAVAEGGTMVQSLDTLMLEALPMDMPAELEVDLSILSAFGDAIHVGEVRLPANVRALADASTQVVTVVAPRVEEEEPEEQGLLEGEELPEGEEAEEGAAEDEAGEAASSEDKASD
ncbi:MAG: 50S ribosomal protein L25 [Chloroflexi bacterium]|nr:50S ribosomal protein L25 [Chloroflexota bacterium]MCZ6707980.1 50S ribosomal protein L25 [Chloroflexota bacterium]